MIFILLSKLDIRYNKIKKTIILVTALVCFILTVLMICVKTIYPHRENITLRTGNMKIIDNRLTVAKSDNYAELRGTIPDVIEKNTYIVFKSNGNAAEVYIAGRLAYEYYSENIQKKEMIPVVYCFVPVSEDNSGAEIVIRLTAPYKNLLIPSISMGQKSAAYYEIFTQNIFTVIFTAISTLIGISLIVFYFHSYFTRKMKNKYLFYWGIFSIVISIWTITDSLILQMFVENGALIGILSFYSFMLLAPPFLQFIKHFCEMDDTHGKIYDLFTALFIVNFIVDNLLYLFHVADLRETLLITHLLIAALLVMVFATLIHRYRITKNISVKYILTATSILAALCILQFVLFYRTAGSHDNSLFLRIGILVYTLILSIYAIRENAALFEESTKIEIYKKLAMYDTLTQCENRAAMDYYIKEAYPVGGEAQALGFAIIDLNNLKETNDCFGHTEGDVLITDTAQCLKLAFDKTVKFYRTGGDEFYIIFNDISSMDDQIERLYSIVKEYNRCHEHEISFAMGTSISDIKDYTEMRRLLKLADDAMYIQKSRMHEEMNNNQEKLE